MPLDIDNVRENMLNAALGLATDTDAEPWGDEDVRNAALCLAVHRIWPRMAKLMREDLAIVTGAVEYQLAHIWDVESLEVSGPSGRVRKEIKGFRNYVDQTDTLDLFTGVEAPPVLRLLLPVHWPAGTTDTLRVTGYAPFECWQEGGLG
jgi:hypothetical protein